MHKGNNNGINLPQRKPFAKASHSIPQTQANRNETPYTPKIEAPWIKGRKEH